MSKLIEENDISITFSLDDKVVEARTLYRTNFGHNLLDFSRSTPSNTIFCHQGGFLLKFIPENEKEWRRLIHESVFPVSNEEDVQTIL
jgi:hypothetical protein